MLRGKGAERSSIGRRPVLLDGVGGGLAEVLWVAIYTAAAPTSGIEVARQITASVFPALASVAVAPLLGVGIHLLLSLLLAIAFAFIVWLPFARFYGMAGTMISALVVLVSIWAVNFFIVMPMLNPAFVTLMPYPVTLISKILFGLAMASVLSNSRLSCLAVGRPRMRFCQDDRIKIRLTARHVPRRGVASRKLEHSGPHSLFYR